MDTPNLLAVLWGAVLAIITLSLLITPKRIKDLFSLVETETSAYTCGIVCFLAGTITVLLNNIWAYDWKTIVTVLGWLMILRGIFQIFFTETAVKVCAKMKEKDWISYAILVAFFVGLISIYFGLVGK